MSLFYWYDLYYWCTKGNHWVKHEDALMIKGIPYCPIHKLRLRTKPRFYKRKRRKEPCPTIKQVFKS